MRGGRPVTPLADRFWPKVDKRGLDECWPWIAGKDKDGYGLIFSKSKNNNIKAHRASYELAFGEIPADLCVLHGCDNPPCVNPAHLFLGTSQENTADRDAKGRTSCGEQHYAAKLSEEEVLAIRNAKNGSRKVSEQFGISRGYLWKVRARLKRKKVWEAPKVEKAA